MLSFGDISPFVDSIKKENVPLICQVQTVEQAIESKKQGADIIVAQGTEAGGHGLTEPLLSLLPAVLNAIGGQMPVVAAGGLVDGHDVQKMLALGAQGVLMGTRFYAAEESEATSEQKQRIIEACGEETVRTRVFDYARGYNWPQPYTGRALRNSFYQKWHQQNDMFDKITRAEKAAYAEAALRNDVDVAGVFVGTGVSRIKEIMPVAQIMKNICIQSGF
jgi:nitronate monooxygenase